MISGTIVDNNNNNNNISNNNNTSMANNNSDLDIIVVRDCLLSALTSSVLDLPFCTNCCLDNPEWLVCTIKDLEVHLLVACSLKCLAKGHVQCLLLSA